MSVEGKASLFVLNRRADRSESMHILADNGLRPLTYQEALAYSVELIRDLTGKWFYLDGVGIGKSGNYTWDAHGRLVEPTVNEAHDRIVRVFAGKQPLYLRVNPTNHGDRRFWLNASDSPWYPAPVVIGVKTPLREAEESMEKCATALERLKRAAEA